MKNILVTLLSFCCFLLACSTNTERDKKIYDAVYAFQKKEIENNVATRAIAATMGERLDSLVILHIDLITTSRYKALLTADVKNKIERMEYAIHGNEEEMAKRGASSDAYADRIARFRQELAGYNMELDSLQRIKVIGEKPAGYYVKARYVVNNNYDPHDSREGAYHVTEDMQVSKCSK